MLGKSSLFGATPRNAPLSIAMRRQPPRARLSGLAPQPQEDILKWHFAVFTFH
jgi:hypothetical protein